MLDAEKEQGDEMEGTRSRASTGRTGGVPFRRLEMDPYLDNKALAVSR
jgi:hypothetical protein